MTIGPTGVPGVPQMLELEAREGRRAFVSDARRPERTTCTRRSWWAPTVRVGRASWFGPASGPDAILEVVEDIDADLIVGSCGHGVGRRLLRGSVSTEIAPMPNATY